MTDTERLEMLLTMLKDAAGVLDPACRPSATAAQRVLTMYEGWLKYGKHE